MRMTSASDKKHDTFDFFEAIFCWRKCFCNWQSYQQSLIFCLRFTPFKTLPYLQSSILTCCPWFIPRKSPFSLYNAGAHFWLLRLEFIRSSPQDWFPQMLLRGVPRKIILWKNPSKMLANRFNFCFLVNILVYWKENKWKTLEREREIYIGFVNVKRKGTKAKVVLRFYWRQPHQ